MPSFFFSNFFNIIISYQLHICYLCCNPQSILVSSHTIPRAAEQHLHLDIAGHKTKFFLINFMILFDISFNYNHFKPTNNIKKVEFCPLTIFYLYLLSYIARI